jgi:hypothetical protein
MCIGKLDNQSKLTKQSEQKEELELSGQYAGPQPSPARRTNKPTRVFASQNLHALLKAIFAMYAADLRHRYKGHIIRNAAVFDSAIRECSRLGYIELVNSKKDAANVPDLIARRLKRVKHFPIWIMGPNFPDEPMNLLDQLRPSMKGGKVIWHHHPSQTKTTWRNRG